MKRTNRLSNRLLIETVLICCLPFAAGLIINYQFVVQGLDGSLSQRIKARLQAGIEQKAGPPGDSAAAENPEILVLDTRRARDLYDSGQALFVDARPKHVYARGHISGAINVTDQSLDEHLPDLAARMGETDLVVYCTGPECPQALELAELLTQSGVFPVYVYTGGWEQWTEAGYPAAAGDAP